MPLAELIRAINEKAAQKNLQVALKYGCEASSRTWYAGLYREDGTTLAYTSQCAVQRDAILAIYQYLHKEEEKGQPQEPLPERPRRKKGRR